MKPSSLKREHPALQKMIFINFSMFEGHFCPPGFGSGYGSRDPVESGSKTDSDPRHWLADRKGRQDGVIVSDKKRFGLLVFSCSMLFAGIYGIPGELHLSARIGIRFFILCLSGSYPRFTHVGKSELLSPFIHICAFLHRFILHLVNWKRIRIGRSWMQIRQMMPIRIENTARSGLE